MQTYSVETFEEWRGIARRLLRGRVRPDDVCFHEQSAQGSLFDATEDERPIATDAVADSTTAIPVPSKFLELARVVACHREADRFQLLYRLLWRLTTTDARLLEVHTDDDVYQARRMEKGVRRDVHKMHAFVRFRKVISEEGEQFIAWHRPDHRIVRLAAPFFARRFPAMNWAILTPDESVAWDQVELVYGPGCSQQDAPEPDDLEDLWRTYYGAIFNPARIKIKAMIREMPVRHWGTLPETEIIEDLLADAPRRVAEMIARQEGHARSAADHLPTEVTWESLREAAASCRGCDLYRDATQTVFGEGPRGARIVLVGEQPGDSEDIAGHPFVGPAGEVLDQALAEAGLQRDEIYVTNAVKHFKFERTETRRLHQKPSAREASACRPWIEAELKLLKPDVLVCLGATAAQSLIAPGFSITRQCGEFVPSDWCASTIATYHPSAILRSPTPEQRKRILSLLVSDLVSVRERLKEIAHRTETPNE